MSYRPVTAAVLVASALVLSSCTDDGQDADPELSREEQLAADLVSDGSVVIADPDGTGAEVSQQFFESSDTVVVSSAEKDDQLQAAAIAIDLGAPMLTQQEESSSAVDAEVQRLGAERVIEVGTGSEQDDEDLQAIEDTAALTAEDGHEVAAVAEAGEQTHDGGSSTPIFVTELTSRAAAATAAASKLPLTVLPYADPRVTSESIAQVDGHDAVALGQQFGDTEHFRDVISLAGNGELPGGGGLVFPGRRMIALYGHPSGPALGQMGEQPPAESVDVVNQYVEEYKAFSDEQVIPAFEIIATVASEHPGDDGNFTNEFDPAELEPYIDAIVDAGGYAVIDLQPGLTTFKEQALLYEDLLKRPNVGLALDAEWKLQPGQAPAAQVGSADAAEINEVTEWLADLTRENNLPQKALIVHQFQVAMLPDRENIDTSRPELSFILHADGHGSPGQKYDTWNVLREGLDPGFFLAWKNFIDEDEPMFTPEQTYNEVDPRPWFVSYQ
ncbi:cell wall-binding repeat-containing protein [Corynebacterium sp. CCUG 69979]|uniref:cell wall-binding repeat-containing protein n=1 Tax=Corynebacterium sp. CCUG 69979 TaxID=2823890 RepID=UPI00210EE53E|nr:cell wall-binding repeat-containing protein [Corynebacterium sp. CCUG 69979]MCQ4625065.1 cell wall-binding repeat-containing protein [Corynebacterium sp. CCUG 69979]